MVLLSSPSEVREDGPVTEVVRSLDEGAKGLEAGKTPARKTRAAAGTGQRVPSASKTGKTKVAKATRNAAKALNAQLTAKDLIFGNEEHIALTRRPKRARKPVSLKHPKRTSPVDVRTIAAVEGPGAEADEPQAIPLSLWDWAGDEESFSGSAAPVIEQASLW